MTEKFKIINNAGDYHLMNGDEELCYDLCSPAMMQDNWNKVVDKLNKQEKTIKELEEENKHLRCTIESNSQDDYINYLKKQNEQLEQELFEARKDYLIETADISDKLYLEDEIEEERKEIFGDNND